jgi:hypothetical protein
LYGRRRHCEKANYGEMRIAGKNAAAFGICSDRVQVEQRIDYGKTDKPLSRHPVPETAYGQTLAKSLNRAPMAVRS